MKIYSLDTKGEQDHQNAFLLLDRMTCLPLSSLYDILVVCISCQSKPISHENEILDSPGGPTSGI